MDVIKARIKEFLDSDDPRLEWTKPAVRKHGFLPLYIGWVAALGIRPNGSFVRWNHEEEPEVVRPLPEAFLQRLALCQGAKRYPELTVLLPLRPDSAMTCDTCGGTGEIPGLPQLICQCGGIGWTIPGEPQGIAPG